MKILCVEDGSVDINALEILKECDINLYNEMQNKNSNLWILLDMFTLLEINKNVSIKKIIQDFVEHFNDGTLLDLIKADMVEKVVEDK